MTVILDHSWLHARGDLHDGEITSICHGAEHLDVHIKDEWWNSELEADYAGPSPVIIRVHGGRIVSGRLEDIDSISEVTLEQGANGCVLRFVYTLDHVLEIWGRGAVLPST